VWSKDLPIRSVAGPSVRESSPRRPTMSEQAAEGRQGWASDIVWVVVYSIVILVVMVLWVHVPA
jgi:hypothetical protein